MQAHSSSGNAINRFGRGVVVAVVAGAAAWVYSWQTSLHAQAEMASNAKVSERMVVPSGRCCR